MIEIKLENTGLRDAVDNLLRLQGVTTVKTLARVLRKSMAKTTKLAKEYAPELTGELKESIRTAVRKPKHGNIVVEVGTVVRRSWIQDEMEVLDEHDSVIGTLKVRRQADARWRWHWVEFGSIHNHPVAYLRGAWDETSSNYIPEIREGLEREIRKLIRTSGARYVT